MAGRISMGARREVVSVVMKRYRSAKRTDKGRILDELCATTGWHRKHAVRALRQHETVAPGQVAASQERRRIYGATTKDALTALWVPGLAEALHRRLQRLRDRTVLGVAVGNEASYRMLSRPDAACSGVPDDKVIRFLPLNPP
jgi:hypothetical protein